MKKKLGEINKNDGKIIIGIKEYKGTTYLDVRHYFYSPAINDWAPTKKGLTINSKDAHKILDLLQEGIETLRW